MTTFGGSLIYRSNIHAFLDTIFFCLVALFQKNYNHTNVCVTQNQMKIRIIRLINTRKRLKRTYPLSNNIGWYWYQENIGLLCILQYHLFRHKCKYANLGNSRKFFCNCHPSQHFPHIRQHGVPEQDFFRLLQLYLKLSSEKIHWG